MLPFLTAYDPLGTSTGGIDPLGALQAYVGLADLLLPGVTTITSRSRYLSMMCWAISNSEVYVKVGHGPSGLASRRKAVEPFERLWALACVAAREAGHAGAADGLRGVTRAERKLRDSAKTGSPITTDFKLLKYQARTGAVATYWTTLGSADLIDKDSGALTHEGRELAGTFPEPPLPERDLARLADPNASFKVGLTQADLIKWGKACHLAAARPVEQKKLAEALKADPRRDVVSRALCTLARRRQLPEAWDIVAMQRLRDALSEMEESRRLRLPTVIDGIVAVEQFHESALGTFETLLWWGTERAEDPVERLLDEPEFIAFAEQMRMTAHQLDRLPGCPATTPK